MCWTEEEDFIRKWQLACEGPIAHVVVMPNVDVDKLEEFVEDLVQSRERYGGRRADLQELFSPFLYFFFRPYVKVSFRSTSICTPYFFLVTFGSTLFDRREESI